MCQDWFIYEQIEYCLSLCFFALKLAKLRIGIEHAKYKVARKAYKNLYIGEML